MCGRTADPGKTWFGWLESTDMHRQHPHGESHSHGHQGHLDNDPAGSGDLRMNWLRRGKSLFGAHKHGQGHTHDSLGLYNITERGIWAVKWSFVAMMLSAIAQAAIVLFTGSVALLADTIHNFTDAAVTMPLWFAFLIARRRPSNRFTYGFGRVEDLAGLAILLAILFSAVYICYESFDRLFHPQDIRYIWAVVAASIVGFLCNEAVAVFRIRVGKQIGSAALVADGYHARGDGITSLAVLFGALGVWLGFPLADPIAGLVITVLLLSIVWQSGKTIFLRLLDGIDPELVRNIRDVVNGVPGVQTATEVRARWSGHGLHVEANVTTDQDGDIEMGHDVAGRVRHQLSHRFPNLSSVTIHVDPMDASGEEHHLVAEHSHGDLPAHSHGSPA